jgi:hypothetical protein
MDQLHIARDRRIRPYRTIVTLDKGRDALAHPRAEAIKRTQRPTAPIPTAQIYRLADKTLFAAAREDIQALATQLVEKGHPHGTLGRHPFIGTMTWAVSWTGQ